ncbi:hypothetical protein KK137_15555 [Croceibacterium sp. LX-88]|uniref:Uncharacterized protein n=1 Tax=Croceibacterium selenioxidans TaxID=2838833 RepID=A0ABS5W7S2_9SPHN|nr:hypothetical protein [Croceibacterium selenioxidans]MBT2135754.1 hypothetical protein [Croceibacterium selenioxidans]
MAQLHGDGNGLEAAPGWRAPRSWLSSLQEDLFKSRRLSPDIGTCGMGGRRTLTLTAALQAHSLVTALQVPSHQLTNLVDQGAWRASIEVQGRERNGVKLGDHPEFGFQDRFGNFFTVPGD